MLGEQVKQWEERYRAEGHAKGREEGRAEGREEGRAEGRAEGLRIGLQQGLEQGLRKGEAELLKRQLEHKFGPLSDELRRRIDEADAKQLLLWGERVLTAERVEEVFQ